MSGQVYSVPFAQIPEWLIDADVSDRAIRVFLVLHRHANTEGHAFPGRTEMAERVKCSTASLDRALNELRDVGAIESRQRKHGPAIVGNDYWLWPAHPAEPSSPVMTPSLMGEATRSVTGDATEGAPVTRRERESGNESQRNESQIGDAQSGVALTLLPPPSPEPKAKRATSFPAEFFITPEMRAWAQENAPGIDLRVETAQFADYHRAKGDTMKDWTAAWRTWMRNAVKFRGAGRRGAARTGRAAAHERTMEGLERVFGPTEPNQGGLTR